MNTVVEWIHELENRKSKDLLRPPWILLGNILNKPGANVRVIPEEEAREIASTYKMEYKECWYS